MMEYISAIAILWEWTGLFFYYFDISDEKNAGEYMVIYITDNLENTGVKFPDIG
jgi:hypothetical protein